jgi:hypothetical protein
VRRFTLVPKREATMNPALVRIADWTVPEEVEQNRELLDLSS